MASFHYYKTNKDSQHHLYDVTHDSLLSGHTLLSVHKSLTECQT